MKYTLLEMTQNILSSMDSDEVTSINDTTESKQVANVIRTAYFNIMTRAGLPEHQPLFSLDETSIATPVLMTIPEDVSKIEWIKYNKLTVDHPEDLYGYVTILPIQQFLDMTHQFNTSETDIETLTLTTHGDNFTFYFKNGLAPTYCTIVDDFNIVFDSYDLAIETNLKSNKTLCFGQTIATFTMGDSFIPDLDEQQFPLLLNEAKSLAFVELKQVPNQSAAQEARRQWNSLQRTKAAGPPYSFDKFPYFGRK